MKVTYITTEYITIGQLLKLEGYISNGGEAKAFLWSNIVVLNGKNVSERGKKVFPGDEILINNYKIKVEKVNDLK